MEMTARTFHDYWLALKRSLVMVALLVVVGAGVGFVLSPSEDNQWSVTIEFEDRAALALGLGMPPELVVNVTPSTIENRFQGREGELAPDLPEDVGVSWQSDNDHGTVEISATASSAAMSQQWSEAIATGLTGRLRSEEMSWINRARSVHDDRVADLDEQLNGLTSEEAQAAILVERAGHVDEIEALDTLETSFPSDDQMIFSSADESSSSSSSVVVSVIAGALLGLFIALAVVYARLLSDDSIRRSVDLEWSSGAPPMATIAADETEVADVLAPLAARLLSQFGAAADVVVIGLGAREDAEMVSTALGAAVSALADDAELTIRSISGAGAPSRSLIVETRDSTVAVLVASYGMTTSSEVRQVSQTLDTVGSTLLGAVLTGVPHGELVWASTAGRTTVRPKFDDDLS